MNKMKMESMDMTQYNIDRIAEMFPQVVTEVVDPSGAKDAEGKPLLKKAVDFEKLKLVLSAGTGDYVVADDEREHYEFTWVGKRQAMIDAATPIRKTLRPCPEESVNFDTTENMYIEGDNLEVLKLLQESYLGKIKMIYIDPPYNTGKDFVYRDNFTKGADEYNEEAGMYDEEDNRLFQNTETNGRFHSDWCSMIYPRLQLARNLLTDDGVIFISIDDNEVENLKKICDEVFGASNFVGNIVWKKKTNGNNMGYLPPVHDYIVCYAKQINSVKDMGYNVSDEYISKTYSNPDNDPRGDWTTSDLSANHKGPYFAITNPITGETFYPPKGRYWVFNENEVSTRIKDGRIIFGKTGNSRPVQKVFVSQRKFGKVRAESWWDNKGLNADATSELNLLFTEPKLFTHPKPSQLLYNICTIATEPNDLILDFFSGSATTAHAVMQLNAEDGGNRKFIMVQLPEETEDKSEARLAGYKNICELGKERIRRAGAKIKSELEQTKGKLKDEINLLTDILNDENIISPKDDNVPQVIDMGTNRLNKISQPIDIGFRVFKTDTTNMKDVYYSAGEVSQATLFGMESNIKEDRTDIDLLYGALLDWGVELTYPHTAEQIDGFTVHTVDTPATDEIDIIACFDENISEKAIREIASRKPLRALFRDHSFADSANKINVYEIFKAVAPDTSVKVM